MGHEPRRIGVFRGPYWYTRPLCFCLFAYRFLSIEEKIDVSVGLG